MSAFYHVCPNDTNFQFGESTLCVVTYQQSIICADMAYYCRVVHT